MLFQWDMNHQEPKRLEKTFWKSARAEERTRSFANQLFEDAVALVPEIDQLVRKLSENWQFDRLATVDRGILRLAISELRLATAPPKVVIDEALELAKKFSSPESPAFLNGILDAAYKSLEVKPEQ